MFGVVRKTVPSTPNGQHAVFWGADPFRTLEAMLQTDRGTRRTEPTFAPRFDVKESKEGFVFHADLPGIKDEDVQISVTGNQLTIAGKRDAEEKKDTEDYHVLERSHGSFSRTFTLPETADLEKVKAELKDGVLTVSLPKRTESQPRRITINKQ